MLHSLHHGDQVAILSNIAGRGLEYAEPWVDCSHDRQLDVVRQVSTGLLDDWNADYRLKEGTQMPDQLLQSWLAHRIHPEQGGRIHGFLSDECGIPADSPAIIFDGHWYPNPLVFALGARPLPDRLQLRGAIGHCHCDFHGLNLLVGRHDGPDQGYYLIDLAMYESEQYLFYDHAYFELARLLFSRGGASAEGWKTIVNQLGRFRHDDEDHGLQTDDIGLIDLVCTMRQGVADWIERNEADRLSYMENQAMLARVAVGLNFSHKKLSLEQRQMGFFYAASNLMDYLKLNRVDWPKTVPCSRLVRLLQSPGRMFPTSKRHKLLPCCPDRQILVRKQPAAAVAKHRRPMIRTLSPICFTNCAGAMWSALPGYMSSSPGCAFRWWSRFKLLCGCPSGVLPLSP